MRQQCNLVHTQVTDMFSELLEGEAHAFAIGVDFCGVYHKGHTVHLLSGRWLLHIAHCLCPQSLIRAELVSLRCVALDYSQNIMEGQASHLSRSQTHGVTQN
uniref:Uncharacterized protein n=1 Tax=Anguilla anguilla TaxID=7936 RepID=A0A0E9Y2K6_ANGAN